MVIGLVIVGLGIAGRMGFLKRVYIKKGVPGVYSKTGVYALVPFGLAFMALGVDVACESPELLGQSLLQWMFLVLMAVGVAFLVWQPRWLKPAWLQWLEFHYGHVLEEMLEEARGMGIGKWEAHVRRHEDLERWADSVAESHGWAKRISD